MRGACSRLTGTIYSFKTVICTPSIFSIQLRP